MEEVDQYLWQVYLRKPVKSDSSGDFTWKDPAAAKHLGVRSETTARYFATPATLVLPSVAC